MIKKVGSLHWFCACGAGDVVLLVHSKESIYLVGFFLLPKYPFGHSIIVLLLGSAISSPSCGIELRRRGRLEKKAPVSPSFPNTPAPRSLGDGYGKRAVVCCGAAGS